MKQKGIDTPSQGNTQEAMTGQNIQNLLEDENLFKVAKNARKQLNSNHQFLNLFDTKQELDKEVKWFDKKLTDLLNNHAIIMQVIFYSKQWQNKKMAKAQSA